MDNKLSFNLDKISNNNKNIFAVLCKSYDVKISELTQVIKDIDLKLFPADYAELLRQVKSIAGNCISVNILNNTIKQNQFYEVGSYLDINVSQDNRVLLPDLTPKLIELNNIYRAIQLLNSMPGTNGKPINLFMLPDYQ